MISTVGVNAQTDQSLKAELFGEVKINFASETLPLDRFADEAVVALLQRHARQSNTPAAAATFRPRFHRPRCVPLPIAPAPAVPPAAPSAPLPIGGS